MSEHLFIGGDADGQWRTVEPEFRDYKRLAVPISQPMRMSVTDAPVDLGGCIRVDYYRPERLRAERDEWTLYVQEDLTIERAIKMLITGYKPTAQ